MKRLITMEQLVEDLKSFAQLGFPRPRVHRYLEDSLIDPAALDPYVSFRDERYTRNLVHKDEDFELLVLCWSSGQRAPIHGHEGELCWARVERGKLRFSNFRMVSETPIRLELEDQPVEGSVGFLDGPADIHAVENLAEFGGTAASLHVYSKPYDECDVYESMHGPRRRVALAYDTVHGKPVRGSTAT